MALPGVRIFFKDRESRFLLVSDSFLQEQAHGSRPEDVLGKTDFDIFSEEHARAALADEQQIIRTGEPIVGKIERETFNDRPDAWVSTTKMPLVDDEGRTIGTFGISRDVTAQVAAEQALAHQALHDSVTNLPNRLALMDRLSQALLGLERSRTRLALLFIDLDNFKTINETFGHETGDRVLVEMARRLTVTCRRGDTVARFGGDEFVLLCTSLKEEDDVQLITSRALRAIGEPFEETGKNLTLTASIGVVVTADHCLDPGTLLRQADIAMYEAKNAGRDTFRLFDADLHARSVASHDLDASVRRAITNKELFLVYQPLFSLDDFSLCGVEALVRWQHPTRGLLMPADFVPLAEQRGLIDAIDDFVLDEACRQMAEWQREGVVAAEDGFTMAVNLSGSRLSDSGLPTRVSEAIARHGIAPRRLCLEVTETAVICELGRAAAMLRSLSHLGVRLALDDFGTGYSTLVHVQRLNVDVLKIDRSFVEQVRAGDRNREIVSAITAMAHALGMSVVAEGIETDNQLGELVEMGCDEGQGFLLARPMSAEQISRLRNARSTAIGNPIWGRAARAELNCSWAGGGPERGGRGRSGHQEGAHGIL
jgi:diguanylate cyclase (GGDEF)-like protein/PAS domain S-box-containing protein